MKIELTTWSIIKVILIGFGFWLLIQTLNIIALLFVVLILVAALAPSVAWLRVRSIPRPAAVTVVMLAVISLIGLILASIIPALVAELTTFLSSEFPALVSKFAPYLATVTHSEQLLNNLVGQLQQFSGNIFTGVISIFGGIVSALTVLALTFYFLLEEHPIKQAGINLWPAKHRDQIGKSIQRIMDKLGAWLRGQFLLSLIVGGLTAIVLSLISVPSPLALGVLAGILEIVPIIGPFVTGIVMVVMAAISPEDAALKIGLTLGFFVILQVVEGQFLVPNVMRQAIGISPFLVIIALLIGSQLGGIPGAILAVPLAAMIQVVAQDWPKFRNAKI